MRREWRRMTHSAVLGAATLILVSRGAGPAVAGSDPGVPASGWTATMWRDATLEERRGYVRGLTEGLRLAAALDRAQVDRSSVMECVQRLHREFRASVVDDYLEAASVVADEATAPFQAWDALLAVCSDEAPRRVGDQTFWVFVSLRHPVTPSPPYLTRVACEAARRGRELVQTTGCHLEPMRVINHPSMGPSRAGARP